MTNKQIDQLNIKIAKRLGWKSFRLERLPDPLQKEKRMTGIAPGNLRHQYIPTYTSNLAYAMQLVDWANEHGYYFELFKQRNEPYEAKFVNIKSVCLGQGTLPSMAICMAFLEIK